MLIENISFLSSEIRLEKAKLINSISQSMNKTDNYKYLMEDPNPVEQIKLISPIDHSRSILFAHIITIDRNVSTMINFTKYQWQSWLPIPTVPVNPPYEIYL